MSELAVCAPETPEIKTASPSRRSKIHYLIISILACSFIFWIVFQQLLAIWIMIEPHRDIVWYVWRHATDQPLTNGNIAHPFFCYVLQEKGMALFDGLGISWRAEWALLMSVFFLFHLAGMVLGCKYLLKVSWPRIALILLLFLLSPILF